MLAVGGDEGRVCIVRRREEETCNGETVACAGSHEGGASEGLFGGAMVPMLGGYFL